MLFIIIGYIFIFFSCNVGNFDLLADFAGYLFLYFGLRRFPDVEAYVNTKPFVLFMAVLSAATVFGSGILPDVMLVALVIFGILLSLYILFMIGIGIRDMQRKKNTYLKADKIQSLFRLQAVFTIASNVIPFIPIDMMDIVASVFGFAALVCNIVFLFHLVSVRDGLIQAEQSN